MGLILSIIIGILAGYIASMIIKRFRKRPFVYVIVGLIGGIIGGAVFKFIGLSEYGIFWQLVSATVGAIILLWIAALLKRK
jgi:uncharacterized membrane protein YeaQ/YmgE (transglycosylase-associated protein family)